MNKCKNCNKNRNRNKIYCSHLCQKEFERKSIIDIWINNPETVTKLSSLIRTFLIKESNQQCSCCGWSKLNEFTNNIPLEIDHINGNASDNRKENLRVLCPNCHSLTSTYKGANKKSTRTYRKTKEVVSSIIQTEKKRKIKEQKDNILSSQIDFTISGWVEKASKILGISPQKTRNWMKRNLPDLEKVSFKRKR